MGERGKQRMARLMVGLTVLMYAALFIPQLYLRALVAAVLAVALIVVILYYRRSIYSVSEVSSVAAEKFGTPAETDGPDNGQTGTNTTITDERQAEDSRAEQLQTEAHRHVMEALTGMANVIPILNEQLKAVIDYTEEAAMELSRSFISINRKAKEQVQDVRQIFGAMSGEENTGSSESALIDIRSNLNSLTEGLDSLLEQIRKNSDSIHSVLRQTKSIEEIVATTNEITENSRVLSINATIEAARAGEHGRGFAVVAGEFKQMTERSEEATAKIEETVHMISQVISQVHTEIEESKNLSLRLDEQTKTQGRESVDKIDSMIDEAKTNLQKLSSQAEAFAKDINSIIVSIQFQDITRQRIEHVIEPLQEFAKDLEKIGGYIENIDQADSVQQLSNFDSAVDRLKQKYTMEAEKELMERSLMKGDE
jgi:methyl-accepting chemotaxis protein